MKHKSSVKGFKSLRLLADTVMNLKYWAVARFNGYLALKAEIDANKVESLGHRKEAKALRNLAESYWQAKDRAEELWKICKPYMRKR